MTYVDPGPSTDFPNRPTHPDFVTLSEAVQGIDFESSFRPVTEVVGIDPDSANYFIENRLGVLGNALGKNLNHALIKAIYLDALATGVRFGKAQKEQA